MRDGMQSLSVCRLRGKRRTPAADTKKHKALIFAKNSFVRLVDIAPGRFGAKDGMLVP
jgi:hypothetical protein